MNALQWILQVLLALAFVASGWMKLGGNRELALKRGMRYVEDFTEAQLKLIGLAELLGGIGLILPAATAIAPVLTPIAATGLALTMLGAIVVHVRRKEYPREVVLPAILLVLSVVVAWGRFGPYAF